MDSGPGRTTSTPAPHLTIKLCYTLPGVPSLFHPNGVGTTAIDPSLIAGDQTRQNPGWQTQGPGYLWEPSSLSRVFTLVPATPRGPNGLPVFHIGNIPSGIVIICINAS